ncbi:TetR/AcrR family transcriptional regulator [uncultured Sphingomonas sp.]|uniref:TetR/AcrR family transcriptional regulator n=1 Tax=uncultured Sphingomonas sp. TaxID=158754 RepID=UPI0035CB6B77
MAETIASGDDGAAALHEARPAHGRVSRRRNATRARLLVAAHDILAEVGVDAAKIKDITDRADVGFGTFYNYFETKDQVAREVLDCIIHDCGIRNAVATAHLARSDPAAVMPTSIGLVIREAASTPIWSWWARRPDLLVDRIRDGFAGFAMEDMRQGIKAGFLDLSPEDVDQAWALACWMIAGGIHDIVVGDRPVESAGFVGEAIVRAWGYDRDTITRVAAVTPPPYGPANIDWSFVLRA